MKSTKKRFFDKKLLFYCCILALPILQYCVFYIYVNINSFILAFTEFDPLTGESTFAKFDNFKYVWNLFFHSEESRAFGIWLRNSLVDYGAKLLVGTGGAVLFAYYVYKKQMGSGFFKIILFLPSIIPGIAMISIYRYVVETNIVSLVEQLTGNRIGTFLGNPETSYNTVLIYVLFMGFGTQVMMYLGAMNKINPSITEAAKLDGAGFLRELWSITLPCIYSTIVTFFVAGLTGVFTSDMGLYSFFARTAPGELWTLGYYLLRATESNTTNQSKWPEIATVGMYFTMVVAPITIFLKTFLDKKDPMR